MSWFFSDVLKVSEFDPLTFTSVIECERPNNDLSRFRGCIINNNNNNKNKSLILLGCSLLGTDFRAPLLLSAPPHRRPPTGHETKALLNNSGPRYKRSLLERQMNCDVLWCVLLLVCMCLFSAVGHGVWVRRYQEKKALFDVPEADGGSLSPVTAAVYSFLTMIIVLQVLIPVSLYVSIEIVKVCQVYFINQDVDLYDEETDSQLQCRALNITEDLGQIRYIFSDKTGTLTENKMVFRRCTVSGMEYSHDANAFSSPMEKDITPDPKLLEKVSECDRCLAVARHQQHPLARLSPELSDVFDFFIALTICNTVVVTAPDQPRQKTPRRQPSGARIGGRSCPSSPDDARGRHQKKIRSKTQNYLNLYAVEGLRTLCIAKRVLSKEEYACWLQSHLEAESAVDNREELLSQSAIRLETNLHLLGATGVEDRLQDGVPETIAKLRQAGLQIWVLTGDKQETAVNIAYACKLLDQDEEVITLNADSHGPGPCLSLVIDGRSLAYALEKSLEDKFLVLAKQCRSVLCCRSTPLQKSMVVKLVRSKLQAMTLAIGDGANDVSMIQVADVGVGISGQEGMQVRPLGAVPGDRVAHGPLKPSQGGGGSGRQSMFVGLLFWFQFFCGFSASAMIDQWYLIFFNLLFSSLPQLVTGVLDKDVPAEALLAQPQLYRSGQNMEVRPPPAHLLSPSRPVRSRPGKCKSPGTN
ncbi:PREDICTED: probable phospholipid-transporting ATPase VA, partial [Myotis brandtii]|uniref:probable phospholipid-transporting ATPase VA n=1 Tax=Myotis brandtii TaxID=109478 RepID=UPI000703D997